VYADHVENNMLQEAFDLGWSGVDWRTASRGGSSSAAKSPVGKDPSPVGAGALGSASEDANKPPAQAALDDARRDDIEDPAASGDDGSTAPPSSPRPSPLLDSSSAAPAPPPAADPPTLGSVSENDEDEDEEEQRRLEWIKYYVKVGKIQEAFDIGWDGRRWEDEPDVTGSG
jgi:hypothetical protein